MTTAEEIMELADKLRWATYHHADSENGQDDVAEARATLQSAVEALESKPDGEHVLYAAPVQPKANEWKEAMLDGLASHAIDAPVDMPPHEVLAMILKMAVMIATDPQVSDLVQPKAEPPMVLGGGSSCNNILRASGKPYPRTCQACGVFGPCRIQAHGITKD